MKNTYLTSYFPLLSIMLFSLSLSIKMELIVVDFLKRTGIYVGMLEFFTEQGMKLALLVLLFIMCFMIFAALKLIANTVNELALLFFSRDYEGDSLKQIRNGSIIFFVGGTLSLVFMNSFIGIGAILLATAICYFIYFVFKVSPVLTVVGTIGLIFFQVIVWSTSVIGVLYLTIKVYNSILASLPI